jgi:hypothetical protein
MILLVVAIVIAILLAQAFGAAFRFFGPPLLLLFGIGFLLQWLGIIGK